MIALVISNWEAIFWA